MPRMPRIKLAHYPVHVVQRGHNHARCFLSDSDREVYLHLLREQAEQFECAVHAYVLMSNHVHLLLTPSSAAAPSLLMQQLGRRYVRYFNDMHERSGTLWEGRFRSSIVDTQHYLLACYRYIELNPVRAAMVGEPGAYRWSSYRANAGVERSRLITPHVEYLALGRTDAERAAAYESLFAQALGTRQIAEIRAAANGNFVLGSDAFKQAAAATLRRRVDRKGPGRPRKSESVPDFL